MRNASVLVFALLSFVWGGASNAAGNWHVETIEDASVSGSAIALKQESAKTIKGESGTSDVRPVIELRCVPGNAAITARIDWQRFISSFSTEVGFKVDGGRFMWLKWKVDQSERVTISPSAEDSLKLIDALSAGSELLVEVSPYSQAPETASFDLSGFSDSLASLMSKCQ
jgi:hypothetical protein